MQSDSQARFPQSNDEVRTAFASLVETVSKAIAARRSTRSAALKPALLAAGVDEHQFGFPRFRDFLVEAEKQGYVRLQKAPVGPDVDVFLPESKAAEVHIEPPIRRDLWRAFTNWELGEPRVYDSAEDVVITPTASGRDSPQNLQLRLEGEPQRYKRIEPISQTVTHDWMRQFASGLPADNREQLQTALQSSRPFKDFVDACVRASLAMEWRATRLKRTREAINKWIQGQELQLDLHKPTLLPPRRRPSKRGESPEDIRQRILHALNKMTTGELLRLAIPAEYLLDAEPQPPVTRLVD